MQRTFLALGAVSGALAVVAGAFGAHGLRGSLSPDLLAVFETAARYHMYHALALIAVAAIATRLQGRGADVAGWLFVAGTVVFSGSLYLLALGGPRWLGAVTPLGGLCFIVGWVALAWSALRG
jgi:uncharacterized membrane protein YgdD (TMEM256/DUF423 family)